MANGRAALGRARRSMIRRQKKTNLARGVVSTLGTIATFAAGQAKRSKTAWGEYEEGFKALGGEGFERPKFGQKGFFKGPKGDVTIGEKIYDREKIQKAGSFLGSDAAAGLDQTMRDKYVQKAASGRWDPSQFTKPGQGPSPAWSAPKKPTVPFKEDAYDVDEEFGYDAWTAESSVDPGFSEVGKDWESPFMRPAQDPSPKQRAQYPQGPSLGSKIASGVKEHGATLAMGAGGAGLMATGAYPAGLSLLMGASSKIGEQFTDKQRQPYMEPEINAYDAVNRNRYKNPFTPR